MTTLHGEMRNAYKIVLEIPEWKTDGVDMIVVLVLYSGRRGCYICPSLVNWLLVEVVARFFRSEGPGHEGVVLMLDAAAEICRLPC